VLDARWRLAGPPGIDDYRAGHVPGAVYIDLDDALSGKPGAGGSGGRHPLPSTAAFQEAMRAVGVSDDRAVVVYDDGDGLPAARAWWVLRYYGHPSVRVLDGGFAAWTKAGLPVTAALDLPGPPAAASDCPGPSAAASDCPGPSAAASDCPGPSAAAVPDVVAGNFTARPGHMPVIDADGAAALARDGVLIDVRTPERYRGETEPIDPVAGHIPGAVNLPIGDTAYPGGTYRSAAGLTEAFAAVGADPSRQVGAYCGSGVTAARGVLALTIAGIPASLYVGSWSDWISDPSRPIATS
jgi:thiosulfate/3-mercaptopyruvate sulfurtransferase